MLPTEQPKFIQSVQAILGAYGKAPDQRDLESWWRECKPLSFDAFEVAVKAHRDDPDRGERAPRPVDITRRMKVGVQDAKRCACYDVTGRCEYPGIFGDGTTGESSYYCPWHRLDRQSPEASAWIQRSREIPWEVASAKRIERIRATEIATAPVVDLSHKIALRHGSKPWQSKPLMESVDDAV